MADTFLDIAADSLVPVLSGTHSIGSNSMVMHSKYIVGPRSMSKSNMQLEDVFWNSIPDTRAQAAGSSTSCGSYIAACWVKWAINPCFFMKRRIQFWQVTWLEGDRNLAIITKTRFRFAESSLWQRLHATRQNKTTSKMLVSWSWSKLQQEIV